MLSYEALMQKNDFHNAWLALDVGTTGVKAFVFDENERVLSRAYKPLGKSFPKEGWVEQEPREICEATLTAAKQAVATAIPASKMGEKAILAIGIANQRETTILWDKKTGDPIYPAIVWEDARTKEACGARSAAHGSLVHEKTGLPVDSYFSASKIQWILDHVSDARARAERGELCFGTVDSWLLWNLAEGHPHVTDYTNASRTLLFNINTKEWDDELLSLFEVPRVMLPEVKPSASNFGNLSPKLFGTGIPIRAIAGDQQASLFAAGVEVGTTKITFGTGIFIMQIIKDRFQPRPPSTFLTTLVAGKSGRSLFALEAKIESCAARVTPLIGHESEMKELLDKFAAQVARFVGELPIRPKELIIDGGVTQAPHLRIALKRVTLLPIREHAIFDGTALGVARILKDCSPRSG